MLEPIVLRANQPADRFYRGGPRIAAFRGHGAPGDHVPEDWVGSTTSLFGEPELGQTILPDGRTLRAHIADDPVMWLGEAHVSRWGADPALLVKLLDAGQRLPVHVHPDRGFAAERLGLAHGKTEAWVLIEPGTMHLGFRRPVGREELDHWVTTQDVDAMLGAMHEFSAEAGESILVPAGMPHAIGEGAFLVELQEPTDLSIMLEWRGFSLDGARDGHLGLGFATALDAVDLRGWDAGEIRALRTAPGRIGSVFPPASAPFFRGDRVRVSGSESVDAGFGVLVVLAGTGELSAGGTSVLLDRGATVLVPHAAGPWILAGELELLRCRPPAVV